MGRYYKKKKKQGPKCIARTVPTLTSNVSNKKDATNEMKIWWTWVKGLKPFLGNYWRVHAYKWYKHWSGLQFASPLFKQNVACEWVRERLDELNSYIEWSQQPKLTKCNSIQFNSSHGRSERFFVTVSEQVLSITSHFEFLPSLKKKKKKKQNSNFNFTFKPVNPIKHTHLITTLSLSLSLSLSHSHFKI